MSSIVMSIVRWSYGFIVTGPRTRAPGAKASEKAAPNHDPNSRELVNARQTRERGARSSTFLTIESVVATAFICNLLVAHGIPGPDDTQPSRCLFSCRTYRVSNRPTTTATIDEPCAVPAQNLRSAAAGFLPLTLSFAGRSLTSGRSARILTIYDNMVHYTGRLMAAQLPPPRCPKCGSHRTEIAGMSQDLKIVHVRCAECGALSPVPARESTAV